MLSQQKDVFARFAAQFQKEGEGRRESLRDHSPFFNSPRVPVPTPCPPFSKSRPSALPTPSSLRPRDPGTRVLPPSNPRAQTPNPLPPLISFNLAI